MDKEALKQQLNDYLLQFDVNEFIQSDPIQFPFRYTAQTISVMKMNSDYISFVKKNLLIDQTGKLYDVRNVEIMAMISAMMAWGNRKTIIQDIQKIVDRMEDMSPIEWIISKKWQEIENNECIHRTLNGEAFKKCLSRLRDIFNRYATLENYLHSVDCVSVRMALVVLGGIVFYEANMGRNTNGAFKRLCMAFRWLVRDSECDLGIWEDYKKSDLYIPLDVHVGAQARLLGITNRRTMDWTTVEEITEVLREFDPNDPVRYDLALFQMGIDSKKK